MTRPSLLDLAAGTCLLAGAIGLVRLPDFFTRVHAIGVIRSS